MLIHEGFVLLTFATVVGLLFYRGDLLYTYYGEGVPGSAMWVDGAPTIEFWSRFLSLQFVLTLLMVIVHTDLGRWVCAIVLQEFLTLFALYMIGDKIIKDAFIKTVKCNAISLAYVLILFTVFAEPDMQMISYSISEFVFNLLSV